MNAPGMQVGDLIVYAAHGSVTGVYAEHLIARVVSVKEKHVNGLPWRMGDRRWDRREFRIDRRKVLAVLAPDADVAAIAERMNELRNERDMRKGGIDRLYRGKIEQFARRAGRKAA